MADVKFRAGSYLIPGQMTDLGNGTTEIKFRYNKKLLEEIKCFEGSRWNPDKKAWTIKNTQRNKFQLEYLLGGDPYQWYDRPLIDYTSERPLRNHQIGMVRQGLTYRQTIFAAEMGTGKSLSAIEVIEFAYQEFRDKYHGEKFSAFWIAPKSALRSVELEIEKWKCRVKPSLHTYDSLKRTIQNWPEDKKAPYIVIGDESSRVKTPTAQRSQAMFELANGIRQDWGRDGFIILMSGTPAPKSPADWYWQCEIAQPGFIREGTYAKFKQRLGLIIQKESIQGGVYPHLVTWLDDENKCLKCGQHLSHATHDPIALVTPEVGEYHQFQASKNEVSLLYERMKGLVIVVFKKDCLDLPDKQYEIIRCKPSGSILRSASIITARSTTVVGAMVLLRELSDGFQYEEEQTGTSECQLCHGDGTILANQINSEVQVLVTEDNIADYQEFGCEVGDYYTIPRNTVEEATDEVELTSCPKCGGCGETIDYKRIAVQIPCPKEDAVKELLDRYVDVGRTVFFAGFSGSIDRLVTICQSENWYVVRVDGRGWWSNIPGMTKALDMLRLFQDGNNEDYPRIAFIGQPGAAGMGLTLTASPMICYYSNDFNAESRIQSEDRIHRMGMDVNRGATIYDLIHLPTDEIVLNNLKKKRELQAMSMGEIRSVMAATDPTGERKF